MAEEEEEEEAPAAQGAKSGRAEAAGIDKITDLVEERELSADKVEAAMAALQEQGAKKAEEARAREKALAAVKVQDADVALVAEEFDLDKKEADTRLREAGGDLKQCLATLLEA